MGPGRTLGGGRGSDDDEGFPGVAAGGIRPAQGGGAGADKTVQLQRTVFKVVFAWKPTPLADRKPWPVELPKPGEGAPLESGNPNP